MRRLFVAVASVVAFAIPAHSHDVTPRSGFVSERMQRRMVRITHRVFPNDDRAHFAMRLFDCESSWRWWIREPHRGLPQFNDDAMATYAIGADDGTPWTPKEQIRSFKRMFEARGPRAWPNCP